jgi:hypothetical protein
MRRVLPQRRHVETFELTFGNVRGTFRVSVGYFEERPPFLTPAEVFITAPKAGSEHEATARDGAVLLSIALQYGVPLEVVRHAVTRSGSGFPGSVLGAVVDMLALKKFLPEIGVSETSHTPGTEVEP